MTHRLTHRFSEVRVPQHWQPEKRSYGISVAWVASLRFLNCRIKSVEVGKQRWPARDIHTVDSQSGKYLTVEFSIACFYRTLGCNKIRLCDASLDQRLDESACSDAKASGPKAEIVGASYGIANMPLKLPGRDGNSYVPQIFQVDTRLNSSRYVPLEMNRTISGAQICDKESLVDNAAFSHRQDRAMLPDDRRLHTSDYDSVANVAANCHYNVPLSKLASSVLSKLGF